MPPKKSESKAAAGKPAPAKKPTKEQSAPKGKGNTLPVWAFFTKNSVEFVKTARELSARLHDLYGPEVTISQFEKLVTEFPSLTKSQQDLVFLDKGSLELLKSYRTIRDSKDTERRSFRSNIEIKDITSGLEACLSVAAPAPESGELDEEGEMPDLKEDA